LPRRRLARAAAWAGENRRRAGRRRGPRPRPRRPTRAPSRAPTCRCRLVRRFQRARDDRLVTGRAGRAP
jgi:hypothetical protein